MRKHLTLNLVILLLLSSLPVFSQKTGNFKTENLIGTWQAESNEISSTYLDTYVFSKNEFTFKPTGYNGLNRIVEIKGSYKLIENKIIFHVNFITEIIGGKIERSMITTLSDSWAIDGGKLVTKKTKSDAQTAILESCEPECLIIDKRKFYKINDDEK